MATKKYNPITPSLRYRISNSFAEITTNTPEKSLVVPNRRSGGRNQKGAMTMRYIGGGHKKQYRIVDFKRNKFDIPATVKTIEYDPNRSAFISLVTYLDGEKRYIIAPSGITVGQKIVSGEKVDIKVGNCLPLENIPVGTVVHNIELNPGKGAQLARSAGSSAQIQGREDKYVIIRLASGESRKILGKCRATIGVVSNADHGIIRIGKAGRTRYLGIRPTVRGSAMNPVDHPHGGGEGRSPIGRQAPSTPWGKPALGKKTRNPKKKSNDLILRRRKGK